MRLLIVLLGSLLAPHAFAETGEVLVKFTGIHISGDAAKAIFEQSTKSISGDLSRAREAAVKMKVHIGPTEMNCWTQAESRRYYCHAHFFSGHHFVDESRDYPGAGYFHDGKIMISGPAARQLWESSSVDREPMGKVYLKKVLGPEKFVCFTKDLEEFVCEMPVF